MCQYAYKLELLILLWIFRVNSCIQFPLLSEFPVIMSGAVFSFLCSHTHPRSSDRDLGKAALLAHEHMQSIQINESGHDYLGL